MLFYAAAIIFFCFFTMRIGIQPKETAENLKKSGAFVPGIRPGGANFALHREDHYSFDADWCAVHHARMFVA